MSQQDSYTKHQQLLRHYAADCKSIIRSDKYINFKLQTCDFSATGNIAHIKNLQIIASLLSVCSVNTLMNKGALHADFNNVT
jgi:hypothetical protein